jgi:4-amino-4-deoxy-L-arabinose transferase-like glycosyltransferase
MSLRDFLGRRLQSVPGVSPFDLLVGLLLVAGGLAFHWDYASHAVGTVGECPFGDAEFWWDGALRVSQADLQDHPGKGFRPGYFVLAGLTVPVLGPSPATFHKFLLVVFLASCLLLYLALRPSFGRLAAFIGVALAVFNPYTAQWLATSTTDGTGLVLHVLALGCLLRGMTGGRRWGWLAAFGVLFAAATLTRPLMTPFIGGALAFVVLAPGDPWRRRLASAAVVLVAFCLPMLLWMAVQRVLVHEWSVSNNDATAFYGASAPKFQVWSPAMCLELTAEAQRRFGTAEPTTAQINDMCWRGTLRNYFAHARYHLDRALPNLWTVAAFPPDCAPAGSAWWQDALMTLLGGGLGVWLLARRCWRRAAALFGAACCVWLFQQTAGVLTIAGVALALFVSPGGWQRPGAFLLALYWLFGTAALYLTGGTWGPPAFAGPPSLNALGYRLGAQVFFSGGLLACYCLIRLASPSQPPVSGLNVLSPEAGLPARVADWFLRARNPIAGRLVQAAYAATAAAVVVVYTAGAALIVRHVCVRHATPRAAYPDPAPVADLYRETHAEARGRVPPVATDLKSLKILLAAEKGGGPGGDVLALGQVGPMLWSLDGEERTLFRLQPEQLAAPRRRGAARIVQVPARLGRREWAGAQGAFVLRRIPDTVDNDNVPVQFGGPVVRGFVPLDPRGCGYALDRAVWFPLDLYATQLLGTGDLHCLRGDPHCSPDSETPDGRRFAILPGGGTGNVLQLRLDLGRMKRPTVFSFAYKWAFDVGEAQPLSSDLLLKVDGVRRGTGERTTLLTARETSADAHRDGRPRPVRLDLAGQEDLAALEVSWDSSACPAPVYVYEMVLRVEERCP